MLRYFTWELPKLDIMGVLSKSSSEIPSQTSEALNPLNQASEALLYVSLSLELQVSGMKQTVGVNLAA